MRQNTGRKLLGILLTLALILGLMPGMSLTAYADGVTNYELWVGGTQVTSANASDVFDDGKVSYTPASGTTPATLTLNNYTYSGQGHASDDNKSYYGIYSGNALTIKVTGTNPVTVEVTDSDSTIYGLYVNGDLTIGGSGLLSVEAGVGLTENSKNAYGIYCNGSLTINGSVSATAGEATVGEGGKSTGVYVKDDIMVIGSLSATAGTAKASFGIDTYYHTSITVKDGGILNAKGGTVTYRGSSNGIYTTYITVENGGIIEATGGAAEGKQSGSWGIHASRITVENGGIIKAMGGVATEKESDSCGVEVNGNSSVSAITVKNGGILNATGGTVMGGEGCYSYGAFVSTSASIGIIVNNRSIFNATGGEATQGSNSYGVYTNCNITVESGGKMNAKGQAAPRNSIGIACDNWEPENHEIVMVDGILIAAGSTRAVSKTIKNSITGIGWTNTEGTEGETVINVNTNPWETLETYKKVQFPESFVATVTTKPEGRNLIYTGSAQELVTAGAASDGTMQYALGKDDKTAPTSGWSTSIPAGTESGTYYVWYKVVGDENHNDTTPVCIPVTIAGGKYIVALVDNGVHEIGDQKDCRITVRSEPDSSMAFDNYLNTRMDAQVMPNGSHTAEKGSLIVTLKATYLDTLAIGKHKATINFKDGSVDVDITIKEGYVVPKTGDSANPVLWLAMMLVALIGFAGLAVTGTMKASQKKK